MSATVQKGIEAVEAANAGTTVPQSDEVKAEVSGGSKPAVKEKTQAALKTLKKMKDATPKDAPKASTKKERLGPKYDDKTKATAKKAEQIRGRARSCGPVQVQRALAGMGKSKVKPEDIVKAFASVKRATAYAAGSDKSVKQPELVKQVGEHIDDAFASGRGLVAICLALAGK